MFAVIKPGLDASLAEISAGLERFLAAPKTQGVHLAATLDGLHRMGGVLQMAQQDGVAVVARELHKALSEAMSHPQSVSGLHRDVYRRALFGITHYLDSLANGADNAALRLFPQYQELQQLRGQESAFEQDLFFPSLAVPLPDALLQSAPAEDALVRVKALRRQYQRGLMCWLRQEDLNAAINLMSQALQGVLESAPQNEARAFWWVAQGLLDCLQCDGLPPELSPRKLLGRIDQQMRALSAPEKDVAAEQSVLVEMLYLIARSHSVSDRVEAIKQTYALDFYLPEISALPPGEVTQLLNVMRDHLRVAGESWEHCTQGDDAACTRFIEYSERVAQQSEKLDRNTLQYLTKQIQSLSQYASRSEYASQLAIDMAMALLLLDSGITHYSNLGSGFQEQARILTERMLAAVRNQPEDPQQLNELVELHCRMEQGDMMAPLAKEMLANLQHVEQGLNAFFNDVSKRDELAGLMHLLDQINGGLRILSLDLASQVLVQLSERVQPFVQSEAIPQPQQCYAIAGAVSALESYLQQISHGQAHQIEPLQTSLGALEKLKTPAVTATVVEAEKVSEVQRPIGEDQELLEVFLEEAQEVLSIMRTNLELSELHPDSSEPLTTMRRGFHTLKGSGRMVGLTDLGEVAWAVERAMNRWLRDEKPATPALLGFIQHAVNAFAVWVDELNNHGGVRIEAEDLVAIAQQFEDGQEPQMAPAPVAPPAPVVEETIDIGEVSLSPVLFRIASAEARQNAEKLRQQYNDFAVALPPQVQYDFMRAAHTLAGVNRTMGFVTIAELAYALEAWLQARMDKVFGLTQAQRDLLEQVVTELELMTQGVCDRKVPQARADLVELLNAGREILLEQEHAVAVPEVVVATVVPDDVSAVVEIEQAPAAEPKAPQPEAKRTAPKQVVRDDVDEQLLPVFLEEADELCPKIGESLRAWREAPEEQTHVELLKRLLHTLKGSARMAGAMRIGESAHEMEDILAHAVVGEADLLEQLEAELDGVNAKLEGLRAGQAAEVEAEEDATSVEQHVEQPKVERRALEVGAERALQANLLRVRSDVVDRLVNEAGEISVARSRIETELRAFKEGLLELTGSVARLRKQLREVEIQAESQMQARISLSKDSAEMFDPLEFDRFTRLQELTRFMNESVHDVQTVQQSLLKNIDETSAAVSAQARINRELQQGLMSVRMVPFASISERLYRIVRQTAKELGKRANLELSGTTVELDRSVLEKMTAPFEHLLRNAIVHGLEAEQERRSTGKDGIGEIRVSLRQESNEVVFEFDDDGAGINLAALRQHAESRGLLQPGEVVSDDQLTQLIFVSGLSTASEVSEVAGRGIGMDVVRSEIAALGGRIDVSSKPGQGTHFTIHLPLTLAVTQALMVRAGEALYALPSTMIEQVRQAKTAELAQMYESHVVEWQDKRYPFHYLPHLLGDTEHAPETSVRNSVLLLRSGEQRIALHVDELQGNHEAVVKNIGPQLARLPGIAGATVRGDGRVVLILNPAQLPQRISSGVRKQAVAEAKEVLRVQPLVMVVDDSLTVRKITSRLLLRSGYQVVTAKDGVDALEQLGEITPALMLLDIEMPRMDGFELTKQLRRDAATQHLPIIMITSRTAEKHRNYAMELGANEYLGKPFQEDELLAHIARLINQPLV
jgi:chemosensory pili system protein ChpA (sensor histidine kinase/response regulator)